VEITVTMPSEDPSESVDDALALEDGEIVHVEGVVTAIDPHFGNFYIQDTEENVGIEVRTLYEDVEDWDWDQDIEIGNKVSIYGELDRLTSFGNNVRQVQLDLITSNDGDDHDLHIEEEMDQDDIVLSYNPYDEDADDEDPHNPGNNLSGRVFTLEDITLIRNQWDDGDDDWDIHVERIDEDLDDQFEENDLDDVIDYGLLIRADEPYENVFYPQDDFEDEMHIDSITFVVQRLHFNDIAIIPIDIDFE